MPDRLPYKDDYFDIGLSSHFLIMYTALGYDFHVQAITEMLRVCKEIRKTQYEFQKGDNNMLVIRKGKIMNNYDIFRKCFPETCISEKIFSKLINVENVHSIEYREDDQRVAYSFIEKNALRLLCVLPEYQGKGIGTTLLKQSEKYIKKQGYEEILTGGVSSGLFIGAPEKSVGFFEKYGFQFIGSCEEMKRSIQDFCIDNYALPVPENTSFGWYQGSMKELEKAVADVEADWAKYFDENSNVFCGWCNNEISSFCIVDYDSECILSNGNNKVGTIGCVGTVHKYRKKGIGLKMVALASEELKKQKCDLCFIHFTGVASWYAKLGYETFLKEYFGVKKF